MAFPQLCSRSQAKERLGFFKNVTLLYPGLGGNPVIIVCVECLLTGKGFYANMILDTGSDETCFPASFASLFGHCNTHPDVKVCKDAAQGIGGFSDTYIHSVRISLLHPDKSTPKKPVIAWSSKLDKAPFVDKLECSNGLIGMDIIHDWKFLSFEPIRKGVLIRITV